MQMSRHALSAIGAARFRCRHFTIFFAACRTFDMISLLRMPRCYDGNMMPRHFSTRYQIRYAAQLYVGARLRYAMRVVIARL